MVSENPRVFFKTWELYFQLWHFRRKNKAWEISCFPIKPNTIPLKMSNIIFHVQLWSFWSLIPIIINGMCYFRLLQAFSSQMLYRWMLYFPMVLFEVLINQTFLNSLSTPQSLVRRCSLNVVITIAPSRKLRLVKKLCYFQTQTIIPKDMRPSSSNL